MDLTDDELLKKIEELRAALVSLVGRERSFTSEKVLELSEALAELITRYSRIHLQKDPPPEK
ncbi:MAG: aspartyl-phosphate phosphatase Spo0E family protein [Firmicutes bacterium]|nr:aspartyl-phosphate phosphatase Spo0E family protein [Bacillota bacterium]